MKAGKILDNSKEKFQGIPVRGSGKKKEESTSPTTEQNQSTTVQDDSDAAPDEKTEQVSDSEDSSWFF